MKEENPLPSTPLSYIIASIPTISTTRTLDQPLFETVGERV